MDEIKQKEVSLLTACALKSASQIQIEIDYLFIQESEHIRDIHKKYETLRSKKRIIQARFYKYIKHFWYHVFINHPMFEDILENDPLSIKLLKGVTILDIKEVLDSDYIEHFFIKMYIEPKTALLLLKNKEITLEYCIDLNGKFRINHDKIEWKKTAKTMYCGSSCEDIQLGSFFECLDHDKELVMCIKEDLFINPLLYYTPSDEVLLLLNDCDSMYRIPFINPNESFHEFMNNNIDKEINNLNDPTKSIIQQFRDMRTIILQQQSLIQNLENKLQNNNNNNNYTNIDNTDNMEFNIDDINSILSSVTELADDLNTDNNDRNTKNNDLNHENNDLNTNNADLTTDNLNTENITEINKLDNMNTDDNDLNTMNTDLNTENNHLLQSQVDSTVVLSDLDNNRDDSEKIQTDIYQNIDVSDDNTNSDPFIDDSSTHELDNTNINNNIQKDITDTDILMEDIESINDNNNEHIVDNKHSNIINNDVKNTNTDKDQEISITESTEHTEETLPPIDFNINIPSSLEETPKYYNNTIQQSYNVDPLTPFSDNTFKEIEKQIKPIKYEDLSVSDTEED